MTDLERRLRDLAEVDPGPVDPAGLAAGARRSAARRRRRVVGGVAVALLAVTSAAASTVLDNRALRADVPANHQSLSVGPADDALCSVEAPSMPTFGNHGLSEDYRAVALCPEDPTNPAWRELPDLAVVHGRFLDGIGLTGGGPPVETCDGSSPGLPAFRVVLLFHRGTVASIGGTGLECGGAMAAQSIMAMLA